MSTDASPAPVAPTTPPPAAEAPAIPVTDRIAAFAAAVGKSDAEIRPAIIALIGDGADGLVLLADPTLVTDADLRAALVDAKPPGVALAVFRRHLPTLRGTPAAAPDAAAGAPVALNFSILPSVPDEPSFLAALKIGGMLRVERTDVISAVKAALARQVGLYDLPEILLTKMEDFALRQEEPCGPEFFEVQKLLTQKRYGEILSVLGVPGTFVSGTKKRAFFGRLGEKLWPALTNFQTQLTNWQQAWMSGAANPAMMMMAITASQTGSQLPPGIMAPPDTSTLHASAEEVINDINRVFAGPGIPVARALALDATRIMSVLNKTTLPAQVGATNREQMLKELGLTVGSDLVRMEQGIVRYALSIMALADVPADAELAYLAAMIQLGATIPWEKLNAPPPPSRRVTGRRPAGLGGDEEDE